MLRCVGLGLVVLCCVVLRCVVFSCVVLCRVVLCCVVLCCVGFISFRFGCVKLGRVGFGWVRGVRLGSVRRKWVSFVPSQVVSFRRCTTRSQHAHIHVSVQSTILNNRA